jgi:hypothetical protein|tara:strand:- start:520 stop:630 length:111 start_codon:yes stop_codon:yes gene_type:complete
LFNLATAMRELGIDDEELYELEDAVRRRTEGREGGA